jgi:predicted branched-subunit amino acid permease
MSFLASKTPAADFGDRRRAYWGGFVESAATPAIVLGASFLGFGALCRQAGWSLPMALTSTLTGWALPGQIVLIELYGVGASALAILFAVWLSGLRLWPMTMSLMPYLRHEGTPRWRYFFWAHFIAITGWAIGMQRCPQLPGDQRLPFFAGFVTALMIFALSATAVGFYLIDVVPRAVALGLLFLSPLYFFLVFATDVAQRARGLALGLGAVAGPLFHLWSPDWGLLWTGLVAGSLAVAIEVIWSRRRARAE